MSSYHLHFADDPYRVEDAYHEHVAGSPKLHIHLDVQSVYSEHVVDNIQLSSPFFIAPESTSHVLTNDTITLALPIGEVKSAYHLLHSPIITVITPLTVEDCSHALVSGIYSVPSEANLGLPLQEIFGYISYEAVSGDISGDINIDASLVSGYSSLGDISGTLPSLSGSMSFGLTIAHSMSIDASLSGGPELSGGIVGVIKISAVLGSEALFGDISANLPSLAMEATGTIPIWGDVVGYFSITGAVTGYMSIANLDIGQRLPAITSVLTGTVPSYGDIAGTIFLSAELIASNDQAFCPVSQTLGAPRG